MKAMALGDTHGDTIYLRMALDIFEKEKFDRLYLTGDLLPDSARLLDSFADKIVAVSGNCDAYFQTERYVHFPMPTINYTGFNGKTVVLTHGHFYDAYSVPVDYDILILGHSHVGRLENYAGKLVLNPGSLAQPRDGERSFLKLTEKTIGLYSIETGGLLRKVDL